MVAACLAQHERTAQGLCWALVALVSARLTICWWWESMERILWELLPLGQWLHRTGKHSETC